MITQNYISEKDDFIEITPLEAYYTDTNILYAQTSKRAIYPVLEFRRDDVIVFVGRASHVKGKERTYPIDKIKFMVRRKK